MNFGRRVLPLVLICLAGGSQAWGPKPSSSRPGPPIWRPSGRRFPRSRRYITSRTWAMTSSATRNQFYFYQNGRWLLGDGLNGPWRGITNPPQAFYNIGPTYFKSPPGWAKGKKTGWGGATRCRRGR